MFLPEQADTLREIAKSAELQSRRMPPERRMHALRVYLLDIDMIKEYTETYLSRNLHLEDTPKISHKPRGSFVLEQSHEEELKATQFAEANPSTVKTFQVITKLMAEYCNDLKLASLGKYEDASNEAYGMDSEASTDTVPRELLPQMVMAFGDRNDSTLGAEDFASGLKHAYDVSAFGLRRIGCPFGQKAATIFAIKPIRISEDEVIISTQKERGALPAFILREIQHGPQIEPDVQPDSTELKT